METTTKKVWTKEQIKSLLEKDNAFLARAVVKIWERQTMTEKIEGATTCCNGVGFNGPDSFIMTKFAEYYNKTGRLTEKQIALARKRIMKYAKQLTSIANA